jgi:hypothetical protein
MCDILLNYEDNHIAMIEHLITSNKVVDFFETFISSLMKQLKWC